MLAMAAMTCAGPVLAEDMDADMDAVAAANRADAQCLAIASALIGMEYGDDDMQAGLIGAVGYYFGRIESRSPDADLVALTNEAVDQLVVDGEAIGERCGSEIEMLGDKMIALGDAIDPDEPEAEAIE